MPSFIPRLTSFFLLFFLFTLRPVNSQEPLLAASFERYIEIPLQCAIPPCFPLSAGPSSQFSVHLDSSTVPLPVSLVSVAVTVVKRLSMPSEVNETLVNWFVDGFVGNATQTEEVSVWVDFPTDLFEHANDAHVRIYFLYNPIEGSVYSPGSDSREISFGGLLFHFTNPNDEGCGSRSRDVLSTQFPELFDIHDRLVEIGPYGTLDDGGQSSPHNHGSTNLNSVEFPGSSSPDVGYSTIGLALTTVGTDDFYVSTPQHTHRIGCNQYSVNDWLGPDTFPTVKVGLCAVGAPFELGVGGTLFRLDESLSVGSVGDSFAHADGLFEGRFVGLLERGDGNIGQVTGSGGHQHSFDVRLDTLSVVPPITENPVTGANHYCSNAGGASNAIGAHDTHWRSGFGYTHVWRTYTLDSYVPPPHLNVEFIQAVRESLPWSSVVMLGDSKPPMGWEEVIGYEGLALRGLAQADIDQLSTVRGSATHNHTVPPTACEPHALDTSCITGATTVPTTHTHTIQGTTSDRPNLPLAVSLRAYRRIWGANAKITASTPSLVLIRYDCFGIPFDVPSVCSSRGECVEENVCDCFENVYGSECRVMCASEGETKENGEVWIQMHAQLSLLFDWFAVERREMAGAESATDGLSFDCSRLILAGGGCDGEVDCLCRFEQLGLRTDFVVITPSATLDSVRLWLPVALEEVTVTVVPYPENPAFWVDVVVPIVVSASVILGILVSVGLVVVCVCSAKTNQQKKNLDKLDKIEDIDILIQEQEAQKKFARESLFSAFKVNKDLFVVDYRDVYLEEEIGRGGSECVVYKARWKNLTVAFKLFVIRSFDITSGANAFVEEFSREVSVLASVRHPLLLKFYGAAVRPPRIGIVLEYCENGDLKKFLSGNPEFPIEERYRMCLEVARCLSYLHSKGIIHRDLKAGNVLVTKNLECRVMDFGISRILKDTSTEDSGKMTVQIGTSGYMAPELVTGDGVYSGAVDIFSYAILVYVVLTGSFRWYGESQMNLEFEMAMKHLRPSLQRIQAIPPFKNLLQKMWSADANTRPNFPEIVETMTELRDGVVESFVSDAPRSENDGASVSIGGGSYLDESGAKARVISSLVQKMENLVAFAKSLIPKARPGGYDRLPSEHSRNPVRGRGRGRGRVARGRGRGRSLGRPASMSLRRTAKAPPPPPLSLSTSLRGVRRPSRPAVPPRSASPPPRSRQRSFPAPRPPKTAPPPPPPKSARPPTSLISPPTSASPSATVGPLPPSAATPLLPPSAATPLLPTSVAHPTSSPPDSNIASSLSPRTEIATTTTTESVTQSGATTADAAQSCPTDPSYDETYAIYAAQYAAQYRQYYDPSAYYATGSYGTGQYDPSADPQQAASAAEQYASYASEAETATDPAPAPASLDALLSRVDAKLGEAGTATVDPFPTEYGHGTPQEYPTGTNAYATATGTNSDLATYPYQAGTGTETQAQDLPPVSLSPSRKRRPPRRTASMSSPATDAAMFAKRRSYASLARTLSLDDTKEHLAIQLEQKLMAMVAIGQDTEALCDLIVRVRGAISKPQVNRLASEAFRFLDA